MHHPANIAQNRPRLKRAKGNDLSNAPNTVLVLYIGNHLFAAILTKIDIEIGHGHPLGIQEPLEQETEAQRVKVGNREGIGDQ